MATTFRGWPEECQRFFIGLELDNSKKYFDANRAVYEEAVKGPMVAIVTKIERSGYKIGGEELKRVPPGFPQDHPRERLLRRKLIYIYRNFGLQPWLGSATARKQIIKVFTDAAPLNDWMKRNVG